MLSRLMTSVLLTVIVASTMGAFYGFLINIEFVRHFLIVPGILLPFLLGIYLGRLVQFAAITRKIHQAAVAFMAALLALYVAWAVDPVAKFGSEVSFAFRPGILLDHWVFLVENGSWARVGHAPTTGARVVESWIYEAGVILGFTIWLTLQWSRTKLYCERCRTWLAGYPEVLFFNPEGFEKRFDENSDEFAKELFALRKASPEDEEFLRATVYRCKTCGYTAFLTLSRICSNPSGSTSTDRMVTLIPFSASVMPTAAKGAQSDSGP